KHAKRRVAAVEPEEGGQHVPDGGPIRSARLAEVFADREEPVLAHEPDDLRREREERDEIDDTQQPEEEPAGARIGVRPAHRNTASSTCDSPAVGTTRDSRRPARPMSSAYSFSVRCPPART